jgi:ribonuclease P protein component
VTAGRTGRFTRTDRLLHSREFQHVTRQGRRAASDAFVVLVTLDGAGGHPRLGVTVSRRVGNAVVRNRVKRRIREWFRRERGRLPAGAEVVVIARREAVALTSREGGQLLSTLVARAADARG